MMRPSVATSSPSVITLLSSSPIASRRLQDFFCQVFDMQPLPSSARFHHENEELNKVIRFHYSGGQWDSVASTCPTSGTVLHFLSVSKRTNLETENREEPCHLSLLGITSGSRYKAKDTNVQQKQQQQLEESVLESRRLLALHMEQHANSWKASLRIAMTGNITASQVLGKDLSRGGLPFLGFDDMSCSSVAPEKHSERHQKAGRGNPSVGIREITIPHYDDAGYRLGATSGSRGSMTLMSALSRSPHLCRPVVGLYQLENLAIRPLPAAQQDRSLPWPSLVFGCNDLDNVQETILQCGAKCAKIGFNGAGRNGQLLVRHDGLFEGLDVRLCDKETPYSSAFSEAQDALLASSLQELQNDNVMIEASRAGEHTSREPKYMDPMNGFGDCWMEFRATMKQPSGFLSKKKKDLGVATPSNLPYQ